MSVKVLTETLSNLRVVAESRYVTDIYIGGTFSAAELDDGSVGVSRFPYRFEHCHRANLAVTAAEFCTDPQWATKLTEGLVTAVPSTAVNCVISSLFASVVSALSAPFISSGGDQHFTVAQRRPRHLTCNAETVLVIGRGGLIPEFLAEDTVRAVDIVVQHGSASKDYQREAEHLARTFPTKSVNVSMSMTREAITKYDFISFSGHALYDGTIDRIAHQVRSDSSIAFEGQSASIHPKSLFALGAKWVATTLKPRALVSRLRLGCELDNIQRVFNRGLPWIWLAPRLPDSLRRS